MANIFIIKNGQKTNIADAVLQYAEPAFAFNADKSKVELYVGTGTDDGKGKLLVNPDVTVPTKVSELTNDSGFQTSSDIAGLTDALNGKAAASHTHAQSDITGLADALNGKADANHTHTVDSALSSTSTNPVQNSVVKAAIDGKLDANSTIDGGTF